MLNVREMCSPASAVPTIVRLGYMCSAASVAEVTKGLLWLIASIVAAYLSGFYLINALLFPELDHGPTVRVANTVTGLILFATSNAAVYLSAAYLKELCPE